MLRFDKVQVRENHGNLRVNGCCEVVVAPESQMLSNLARMTEQYLKKLDQRTGVKHGEEKSRSSLQGSMNFVISTVCYVYSLNGFQRLLPS